MSIKVIPVLLIAAIGLAILLQAKGSGGETADGLILPEEKRFSNMAQLTFGGENAECYFSFDGRKFIFQSTREGFECDQIFTMNADGSEQTLVSTGKGRTTCAYFLPGDKRILYASTHAEAAECPNKPDFSMGYVWALYPGFEIYSANADGSDPVLLAGSNGYDAEATVSPAGDRIVFTSTRSGDIEIFSMNIDGSDVKQLTDEPGYDGGPFYSYDGKRIVYRRTAFRDDSDKEQYKELLSKNLVRPSRMEIWIMDADGSNKIQVTNNGAANFAPYWFPDGKRILFCSNIAEKGGRNFDIYMINTDGTGLERVTYYPEFDGFPMFSPDGKKLVLCSNRNNALSGETNVFVCDWVE